MSGKGEGLGIHNIVGTGTLKYTVLYDNVLYDMSYRKINYPI